MYVHESSGASPGVNAPSRQNVKPPTPYKAPAPVYHAPAPVYHAPPRPAPPKTVAPPSGKTIGSNSQGHITPIAPKKPPVAVAPKPAPPAPPKPPVHLWNADEDVTYQQQEADARNALADYLAGQTNSQNQYNIEQTRNTDNLAHNKQHAFDDMKDDYSSRGLATSGMYLKAMQDQSDEYARQQDVLNQAGLNFGTTAISQLGNFKSTQLINDQKYRNDAINRHAAGMGLV